MSPFGKLRGIDKEESPRPPLQGGGRVSPNLCLHNQERHATFSIGGIQTGVEMRRGLFNGGLRD